MFYIQNDDKIILFDVSKENIENTLLFMPQYADLEIKETDEEIENFMFVGSPEWTEWKSEEQRKLRDSYLTRYVDPLVTNPLRWEEMSIEEQDAVKAYRQYLLDIPQSEDFPNIEVLTFEEWKEQ